MAINNKLKQWKFSNPEVCSGQRRIHGPANALILITMSKERALRIPVQFKMAGSLLTQASFHYADTLGLSYDDGIVVIYRDEGGRTLHKPTSSGRATVEFSLPPAYAKLFAHKRAVNVEAEPGKVAFVLTD